MPLIESMLGQAAGMGLGTIYGLALEKHQDQRQLRQQDKLLYQQQGYNKEMTEWNRMQQLKLWEETNYKAQMEQLRKAGLNPGLIYGMSGGGGATTNIAQGNVSGASAPQGGGEIPTMTGMGIQSAMAAAQIENIKAQTEKTKAETAKTTGVDTELGKTQIASLTQGIANAKITESILKWEDNLKRIDSNIAEQTQGDRMGQIVTMAETSAATAEMIQRDNEIAEETKASKIQEIRARSAGAVIDNLVKKAGIQKTAAEIQKMAADICLGWAQLDQNGRRLKIDALYKQMEVEKGYDWRGVRYEFNERDFINLIDKIMGEK